MPLDHKRTALRGSLTLDYRPTTELLLDYKPRKTIEITQDFIPFLCSDASMNTDPISLDFSESQGPILFVSPTGAGKTFALRGLVGELIKSGYMVADLSSIKNSFYWSMKPIQEKFRNLLPPWREPGPLPVVPFLPKYIKERQGKLSGKFDKMIIGQLPLNKLDSADFWQSCLGLKRDDAAAGVIQNVWLPKYPPKNMQNLLNRISRVNYTIAQRLNVKLSDIKFYRSTMSTLMRNIGTIKQQKIFGEENPIDFVNLLLDGYFPSLCFNWCRDKDMMAFHAAYIAAIIRQVHRAKTKEKIPKRQRLVYVFDDIGTLACPSRREPSCKDLIINDLVSLGREANEYVVGTTQTLTQIPDELILQAKYLIFFGEISGDDLRRIAYVRKIDWRILKERLLYKKDEYGNYHPSKNRPMRLPDGRRSCTVWDKNGRIFTGWVPAPSSAHNEAE